MVGYFGVNERLERVEHESGVGDLTLNNTRSKFENPVEVLTVRACLSYLGYRRRSRVYKYIYTTLFVNIDSKIKRKLLN